MRNPPQMTQSLSEARDDFRALRLDKDRIEAERDAANALAERARNEALEEAAEIAEHRADVCSSAATHFNKTEPSEPYWAASERCAERECKHLAIQYRALKEASK
jgi:hypothetical protein